MAKKELDVCSGIKWVDLLDPSTEEIQQLGVDYRLNEHSVRDCMQPEHLPKYEMNEEKHFLILRFYAHNFNSTMTTIQEMTNKLAVFFTEEYLITIHKAPVPFLDMLRKKYVEPGKCSTASDLLTRIVWHSLETFDNPANRLSEQIDFYENQIILKKNTVDPMEPLYFIKRQASIAHKVLLLMQ